MKKDSLDSFMPHPHPTLKDIAKKTGFTEATVSRILAGKAKFAKKTQEEVEAVAKRLGYRPNRLVSGIQSGKTGMIGVIIPIHAEWGAKIVAGMQRALVPQGYVPIVLDCPSPVMNELEMITQLLERRVEGIALFPRDDDVSDRYFYEIHDRRIPLVVIGRHLANTQCHFVGGDDLGSGRIAAEHFISRGHRILGHLAGPWSMSTGRDRAAGFHQAALLKSGVTVFQTVMPGFLPDETLIGNFLKEHPTITAVYCANEAIAMGLYAVARRQGISIPKEISVIAHGDGKISSFVTPRLTSTVENNDLMGLEAGKMLLTVIQNPGKIKLTLEKRIPTKLIVRESTAEVS